MKKTIGILGGMGPEASSYFYHLLIELAHRKYGAIQDSDFPPTIIYNLPLAGFDEKGIVDKELVVKQLIGGVQKLERAGSDLIIIACNTVHTFYNEMQSSVKIPIINIVTETVREAARLKHGKVGIIGSQSTNDLGLYKRECENNGLSPIVVNDDIQKKLNEVILHVMAGTQGLSDAEILKDAMNSLISQGARAIILGCTELPLAIRQSDVKIPLFNSNEIVLEMALKKSLGVE